MTRPSRLTPALGLILLSLTPSLYAQGSREDYERSRSLRKLSEGKVFRDRVEPRWFAGKLGPALWYRLDLADGQREFVRVDIEAGKREAAFDAKRLAEALAKASEKEVDARRPPIDFLIFEVEDVDEGPPPETLRFNAFDRGWRVDLESYEITETEKVKAPERPRRPGRRPRGRDGGRRRSQRAEISPDGQWAAVVRAHDVILKNQETEEEFPLTDDATEEHFYTGRFAWSPDSRRLIAYRTLRGQEHKVHHIESAPRDQLQPKLHEFDYLKPGDRIPLTRPRLFDVEKKDEIPLDDALYPNPWRISRGRWDPDSRRFTFLYNERGHRVLRVVAIDAETGETGVVIEEAPKTYVDYAHKTYLQTLEESHEIIWMSERDGWNHLYLYDARTGDVKNPVTRGEWVVRGVDRVDVEKRQVWFRAGGIYPEQDPYHVHHCRVNLDGTGLVVLTRGNGTHEIDLSPDGAHLVDRHSRVDRAPVTELRRTSDGSLICELERGDDSALRATGWRPPERFVAPGRDGKTPIYGVIHRPRSFDASKKYPVVEKIYAGPQGAFVPKSFRAHHSAESLAELGFIVVQIDGMGTSHRSKAFHDVSWKNLGDSGFPDRIAWMKAAQKKYPSLDLERGVGVFGGSAGGQSALRALLAFGDFYSVAVSDCGCHDNRMDKIWWNELYMGWPVGKHYEEQSNVTQAHRLEGKLLLMVGELDRNVDPASTMQVVDALVKADKDFDLLVVPGGGHGTGGSYGTRRRHDFFVRHLLGLEPRSK